VSAAGSKLQRQLAFNSTSLSAPPHTQFWHVLLAFSALSIAALRSYAYSMPVTSYTVGLRLLLVFTSRITASFYLFASRASHKCGPLLRKSRDPWSVCLCVLGIPKSPAKTTDHQTQRDVVWRDWSPKGPCIRWGAHLRHLVTTTEWSLCGYAALYQITLHTFYFVYMTYVTAVLMYSNLFSANPSPLQDWLRGFPALFTETSEQWAYPFLFFLFCFTFLVFGSVL